MMNAEIPVRIRKAGPEDITLLVSLGRQTFRETFASSNSEENMTEYLSGTFTREKISNELSCCKTHFFIACLDEQAVGYAKLVQNELPGKQDEGMTMEVERIYVMQQYQLHKAGAALMDSCLKFARKMHAWAVWLGVWEHNAKAIRFYRQWGFEPFGSHLFKLGKDEQTDILMKKVL